MRQADPKHQSQLHAVEALPSAEFIRRIQIGDYKDADFIASEVLAILLRNRAGRTVGVETAAVMELNRRIQMLAGKRMGSMKGRPEVERRGDQALQDTIDYIWERFFEDKATVSNSEVRFAVYVRDRFDDFMRHLRAEKNSMASIDGMEVVDEDGNSTPLINTIEDVNAEAPDHWLERKQRSVAALSTLMNLPKPQRDAFYFRAEFDYEWAMVAELLGCSVTTAQKYYAVAVEKLNGASE